MRCHWNVECLGHVCDLEPRCDASNSGRVRLDDRSGVCYKVFTEMTRRVNAFPNCDRDRARGGNQPVASDVVSRQRLLEPEWIEVLIKTRAASGVTRGERLIRIQHEVDGR